MHVDRMNIIGYLPSSIMYFGVIFPDKFLFGIAFQGFEEDEGS